MRANDKLSGRMPGILMLAVFLLVPFLAAPARAVTALTNKATWSWEDLDGTNFVRSTQVAEQFLDERGCPAELKSFAKEVMQAAGYRVPEDVALVGFDDILQAQTSTPPLTTVRLSFQALGSTAANLLLSRIGTPIDEPRIASAQLLLERGRRIGEIARRVEDIFERELGAIGAFCAALGRGEFPVC